jgi:hypothetical protein
VLVAGQNAWTSASTNTGGGTLELAAGNSQNAHFGSTIQLGGGSNTANSTASFWLVDSLTFQNTSGTNEAILNTSGAPLFYPYITNTGTLGQSANVWSNVYSTNLVLTGPSAHSVLIGEGTSNIAGVGPSANTGAPLLSGGASADPAYGPLNLAGGSTIVTGTLPSTNLPSLAGDVTGAIGTNIVALISASTGNWTWAKATASPTIKQATQTTDVAANNMAITAQSCWLSGTQTIGGYLTLSGGSDHTGALPAQLVLQGGSGSTSGSGINVLANIVYFETTGAAASMVIDPHVAASPVVYPNTTGGGSLGQSANIWGSVYSATYNVNGAHTLSAPSSAPDGLLNTSSNGAKTQVAGGGVGTIHSASGQIFREMAWFETTSTTAVTFYTLSMPSSGNHCIFGKVRAIGKNTGTLASASSEYNFTAHSTGSTATSDACTIVGTAFGTATITAPASSNTITLQIVAASGTWDWQFDIEWMVD